MDKLTKITLEYQKELKILQNKYILLIEMEKNDTDGDDEYYDNAISKILM